jgi:hypothetical protein
MVIQHPNETIMTLIERIRIATLDLRKARHELAALGQTLIGEAEMIGKNNGNRVVADEEVVIIVKKFIKNINETLTSLQTADIKLLNEKTWLETWLPTQLSTDQLRSTIRAIRIGLLQSPNKPDMGRMMKILRERFDGQYDGKLAAELIKAELAN